jgi:sugar phosphate isomerase/epimerase
MSEFKVSICSASYGHADLYVIADRLASIGYDGIEITVMYHADPAQTSAQKRREIRRHLEKSGLAISGLHFIFGPGLKMTADDSGDRARVTEHINSVLDLAHDLGAPIVVVGGGGVRAVPASMDRDVGVNRVVEVLGNSARRAEQLGVAIGLEAINRYETNLGRTLGECKRLVQAIGSPAMKLVGDTFHMNIEEASLADSIADAGPLLAHLQVEDSNRLSPGGGHIDFPPIIEALRRINYRGFLSFEFFWIAPELLYLPTFEACDAEAVRGLKSMRALLRTPSQRAA